MQAAIEARAVTYRTRAGEVMVRDMSLTVGHGELVAIIGDSASGRTTLLDALSGLRSPTSGTVLRNAQDNGRPATGAPSWQVGYVPTGDAVDQELPLARALRYSAALRGVHGREAAVAQALDRVGLAAEAAVPVGALSPAGRRRAAIAAELLADPTQLFLDEPTAGLDPAQATELLRLLRRLSGTGMTVLLTTSSPLDAARCDRVAVLATGGHLAFYGTPSAARGYFGADSLEEIYERLAGLGDPAAAWSRRFLCFVPTPSPAPGPAFLVPDLAGPHSAGRPTPPAADQDAEDDFGSGIDGGDGTGPDDHSPRPRPTRSIGPARQLPVLVMRNAEVLARGRRQQAILAGVLAGIFLAFCVLLCAGALDGPASVTLAWVVLGGLATGLATELPARTAESGVLRRERFAGLSTSAFVAARAAVLLPALAVADMLILAVPAIADRLKTGFALSYLAVFLASALGFAAATSLPCIARRAVPSWRLRLAGRRS